MAMPPLLNLSGGNIVLGKHDSDPINCFPECIVSSYYVSSILLIFYLLHTQTSMKAITVTVKPLR